MAGTKVVTTEMQKAYKYRLYPTEEQAKTLDNQLYLCRKLYNAALEERITWHKNGTKIGYIAQARELPVGSYEPWFMSAVRMGRESTWTRAKY